MGKSTSSGSLRKFWAKACGPPRSEKPWGKIPPNAQWVFSEPEIRFLGLERFFETVVLSSRYYVRKPAPQIYAHALRAMRLDPSQALYVGNDPREDVPGPQALGMPVALIHRNGPPLDTPVPLIRDLKNLPGFIENHLESILPEFS